MGKQAQRGEEPCLRAAGCGDGVPVGTRGLVRAAGPLWRGPPVQGTETPSTPRTEAIPQGTPACLGPGTLTCNLPAYLSRLKQVSRTHSVTSPGPVTWSCDLRLSENLGQQVLSIFFFFSI